jgi:hypothetical protein
MARKDKGRNRQRDEPIPPGARTRAGERDLRPGEPADRVPVGDEAGSPAGGTDSGVLAEEFDEGVPRKPDPATQQEEEGGDFIDREGAPYGGFSGGAVGGAIAQGRSAGGHVDHGIAGDGSSAVDTTIGRDPEPRRPRRKKRS